MGSAAGSRRVLTWYVIVSLGATLAYPALPVAIRPTAYLLIALTPILPVGISLVNTPKPHRRAARLFITALLVLGAGNTINAVSIAGSGVRSGTAQLTITVGHVLLLLSALLLVRQHGRDDVGGVIDMAVVAIAGVGVLWTILLHPRLTELGVHLGGQASLLTITMSLSGILGALLRLELVSRQPLLALRLFMGVLLLSVVGNLGLALTGSFVKVHRPPWLDVVFLLSYVIMGVAASHRSMVTLLMPGPTVEDRLSVLHLVFLGVALGINPVVAGFQQALGLSPNASLLAIVTAAIVPLVMVRIGWLSAQRLRAERALGHQATHDPLTGLPNRVEFLARLTTALGAGAGTGRPVLLFCDLDGFKAVNDRFGHVVGDELLRRVAGRLVGCLRDGDTLARYGGDEFVILCPSAVTAGVVDHICQRIEQALSTPFDLAGEAVRIGVSVGAVTAVPGMDADDVVRRADEAMYVAKRNRDAGTSVSLRGA
ncbi:diguanylate cyclase domain-containing protein [Planosporangium sp. 12N6]|uniref:diguanylate cyclase domain-containing protein n=1 Tax=Planosporangium spinosum TaxID=3402278 RepID=UPI003CF1A2ED